MSVQVTTLQNGIRVASDSFNTVETVSIGAWVETGARNEPAKLNGISHLFEHMAFKGTTTRSARAISETIENVGGQINAYTSRENTAYYAKVLAQDAGLAINVIADFLQNSILDEEELEREKSVICQEIRQTNDTPDDIIFDYFQEYAYPNQAMGRPVLGNEKIVCSISRDTLRNYVSEQYSASRIIISAAGKIDHATLVSIAANAFSNMQNIEFEQYIEPAQYLGGTFHQSRDLEQVHILLGANGFAYEDENFYPASVFSALFGGGMSSRLFQKIREEHGLVYSIYSFLTGAVDSGLFGIYAGTSPEEADKLLPLLRDEIDTICSGDNITIDEVARARAQLKASVLMARESTSARAEQLARQLMIFKRPKSLSETVEKIENVSVENVLKSAQKIFSSSPTMVSLGQLKNFGDMHNFSSTSI